MSAPEFYKAIIKKSDFNPSLWALLSHLLVDALLLGGVYLLLNHHTIYSYVVAQVLWPIFFFRNFGLMHDAVHSSAAKKLKINNLVGYIAGAFCFLPFYPWKKAHLQHHYWAGNVEKDPVMKLIRDYSPEAHLKNNLVGFAWKSWIPLLALLQQVVFWAIGLLSFKDAKTWNAKISTFLSYAIPVAIYYKLYDLNMLTFTNAAPGIFVYLMMIEIINFPHHLELPQNHGDKTLHVWEQYKISRSCSYPRWFSRWILNNFNYHAEHHIFPKAPWYKLDEIHEEVRASIGSEYNYSHRNEWILKNRKKSMGDLLIYKGNKTKDSQNAA